MKTIKILVVLMAISYFASAQTPYIGAKAAWGITRLPGSQNSMPVSYQGFSTNVKLDISFGRSYGIYGGIQLLKLFKLQGELLLTQITQDYKDLSKKMIDANGKETTVDFKAITDVKAMDIPIMFSIGNLMYVEAGPVFNVMLKSTFQSNLDSMQIDGKMVSNTGMKDINMKDKYQKINIGLGVGTGTSISFSHIGLFAGIRYYMGLNKFGKSVDELKQNVKTERTGVWSVMAHAGARFIF